MKSSLMVTDVGVALEFLKKTLVRKAVKTVQTKSELGLGQKRQLQERLEKFKMQEG